MITEWRARQVVAEVNRQLTANMEIAAKVVETDARRNLLEISEPKWGQAYRRLLALYRLTSIVTSSPHAVEAAIGIPPGKTSYIGWYIETGSRTAPPHPWLRPALLHNLNNIIQLLSGE